MLKYNYFQMTNKIVSKTPFCFSVDKKEAIDINNYDDFYIASKLIK